MLVPIREFVHRTSSDEERSSSAERAARAVAQILEKIGIAPSTAIPRGAIRLMDDEHENILAAWGWAVRHDPGMAARILHLSWTVDVARGRHLDLLRRIAELQPLLAPQAHWDRAAVALASCSVKTAVHRDDEALEDLVVAEAAADLADDMDLRGTVWLIRTRWNTRRARGKELFEGAIAFFKEHPNAFREAQLLFQRGFTAHLLGDTASGVKLLEQAVSGLRACGDIAMLGGGLLLLGSLYGEEGRAADAYRLVQEARESVHEMSDPGLTAFMLETDGRIQLLAGNAVAAEAAFRESLAIWTQLGSGFQMADQLLSLTRALIDQDRNEEAAQTLVRSADYWYADGNAGGLCQSLSSAAILLARRGDVNLARRVIAFSRAYLEQGDFGITGMELRFRELVASNLGEIEPWPEVTDLDSCLAQFAPLRG
jgi:tetratricopeptide (TPR) repeat protein